MMNIEQGKNRVSRNERHSRYRRILVFPLAGGLLLGACSNDKSPQAAAPDTTAAPPTTEQTRTIEYYVDPQSLAGPTAMTWSECPPGGRRLPDNLIVNGFNHGDDRIGEDGYTSGTTEIDEVTEYLINDQVVGWCGKSIGEFPDRGIKQGPPEGVITFIPAIPGCDSEKLGLVPPGCNGMPVVGFEIGHDPANEVFDLEAIVPSNPIQTV